MRNQWCLNFADKLPKLDPSCTVLEVGSRKVNGTLRDVLKQKTGNWTGVDIEEGPGVDIIANVLELSRHFPPASFDLVISTETLEHCPDWRGALKEMVRVLKPGGLLLLTTRSPGFELHDYPGDYHRFSLYHFRRIFMPVGSFLALESDMTLGWPCGVGIIVKKSNLGFEEEKWNTYLDEIEAEPVESDPLAAELRRSVFFDQYSRYSFVANVLKRLLPGSGTILDVGGGYDCLLRKFLPEYSCIFLDPLLSTRSDLDDTMIPGLLPDSRLAEKRFDFVTAVDVLEHIPEDGREDFLRSACSHAEQGLVLLFPAEDYGDAKATDKAVAEKFRLAHQHENPWLYEHEQYGLPNLENTANLLRSWGWHVTILPHGHAPALRDLLPIFLALLETPMHHHRLYEISEEFNSRFYKYDMALPCYRAALIATQKSVSFRVEPSAPPPQRQWDEFIARAGTIAFCELLSLHSATAEAATELALDRGKLQLAQKEMEVLKQELKTYKEWQSEIAAQHNQELETYKEWLAEIAIQHEQEVKNYKDWLTEMTRQRDDLFVRSSDDQRLFQKCNEQTAIFESRLSHAQERIQALESILEEMSRDRFGTHILHKLGKVRDKYKREGFEGVTKAIAKRILPAATQRYIRNKRAAMRLRSFMLPQLRADKPFVFFFPIIPWDLRWQRPQQIMSRLSKRDFNVFKLTCGASIGDRPRLPFVEPLSHRVFRIPLNIPTAWNIYTDVFTEENASFAVAELSMLFKALDVKNPIFIIQFPTWIGLVERLKKKFGGIIVFDCMDEHSGFDNTSEAVVQEEDRLMLTADLVFAASAALYDKCREKNTNVALVRNGTEFEHFNVAKDLWPERLPSQRPVIGYYGAIADWFDMDIVLDAAQAHPEWDFTLIGHFLPQYKEQAAPLDNITFLGEKPYTELPRYLASFDVCMIPFKLTPLIEATNPVKFYEYLSCAKPVVAVDMPELRPFSHLCYLAKSSSDFVFLLEQAFQENLTPELEKARLDFAAENSWDSRVEVILQHPVFSSACKPGSK